MSRMEIYCQVLFYLMVTTAVHHTSLGDHELGTAGSKELNDTMLDATNPTTVNQLITHLLQVSVDDGSNRQKNIIYNGGKSENSSSGGDNEGKRYYGEMSREGTLEDKRGAPEEITTDDIPSFNTTDKDYRSGSPKSHLQTENPKGYIVPTTASRNTQSSESLINSTTENVTNGEILSTIPFTDSTTEDTVKSEDQAIYKYVCLGAFPFVFAIAFIVIWRATRKRRKRKTSSTPSNSGSNNEEKELSTVVISTNDNDVSNKVSATCNISIKEPEKTVETGMNESTCTLKPEGPYELAKIIRESIIRLPDDSAYDDIDFNPKSMNSLKGPCNNLSQTSLVSANEGEYDMLRVAVENRRKQKESIYARVDDDEVYSHIDNAGVESRKNHIGNESDYDNIKLDKTFGDTLTLPPSKKSLSTNVLNVYDTKTNFPGKGDYHIPNNAWTNLNPKCQDKSKYYRKSNVF